MQQGAFEQELAAEDVLLLFFDGLLGLFLDLDREQLLLVVPLVDGGADVEAFIALQSDETRSEQGCEYFGDFRLAQAGVAFDQKRLAQSRD